MPCSSATIPSCRARCSSSERCSCWSTWRPTFSTGSSTRGCGAGERARDRGAPRVARGAPSVGGRGGPCRGPPLRSVRPAWLPVAGLVIVLMSVFGTGAFLLSVALAVVYTPVMARVARAAVLATKIEVYVDGARALGATVPRLVLTHILPNAAAPMLVQASVLMAIGILIEAALAFLGVGVRPPTPSLGLMLAEDRKS